MILLICALMLFVLALIFAAMWGKMVERRDKAREATRETPERQRLVREAHEELDEMLWSMALGPKPAHITAAENLKIEAQWRAAKVRRYDTGKGGYSIALYDNYSTQQLTRKWAEADKARAVAKKVAEMQAKVPKELYETVMADLDALEAKFVDEKSYRPKPLTAEVVRRMSIREYAEAREKLLVERALQAKRRYG